MVDGDVAFVDYAIGGRDHRATRITLRDGLIWEILDTPVAAPSSSGGTGAAPCRGVAAVVGATAAPSHRAARLRQREQFCTLWFAEHGDSSLPAAAHRRCMIAIAQHLRERGRELGARTCRCCSIPRVAKHGLGDQAVHGSGNGDEIRTEIGVITRVIRGIRNRQWTVEGDKVWIVYDGYLVTSLATSGFAVAERFTIRNGLIWEIMIAPVTTSIAPVG